MIVYRDLIFRALVFQPAGLQASLENFLDHDYHRNQASHVDFGRISIDK